jgi:hypothetical protein
MTRRFLVLSVCLLLSAATTLAQSPGGKDAQTGAKKEGTADVQKDVKGDPITGTWTGELTPRDAPGPVKVTMALKFDGKSAVTGTVDGLPNPAEVKKGTFDPKSGALKLQLGKTSGPEVLLVLDGTVAKGAASGTVTGDGGGGEFKIAKK